MDNFEFEQLKRNKLGALSHINILGVVFQKQVLRAGTGNYIPQYLWNITTPDFIGVPVKYQPDISWVNNFW